MKVAVGIPTLNSRSRIAACLDCILQQSHADLEVIISNNASVDGTGDVCDEYARRDPRVTVHHQPATLCMRDNFRFVLDKATAPLFHWRSDDDLSDLDYLEKMGRLLSEGEGDNGRFLSAGGGVKRTLFQDGREMADSRLEVPRHDHADPYHQVKEYLLNKREFNAMDWFNGVWDTQHLRSIVHRVWQAYPSSSLWGTDYVTVLPALLTGRHGCDKSTYYHKCMYGNDRDHHARNRQLTFAQLRKRRRMAQLAKQVYVSEVGLADLPADQKAELLGHARRFGNRAAAYRPQRFLTLALKKAFPYERPFIR